MCISMIYEILAVDVDICSFIQDVQTDKRTFHFSYFIVIQLPASDTAQNIANDINSEEDANGTDQDYAKNDDNKKDDGDGKVGDRRNRRPRRDARINNEDEGHNDGGKVNEDKSPPAIGEAPPSKEKSIYYDTVADDNPRLWGVKEDK